VKKVIDKTGEMDVNAFDPTRTYYFPVDVVFNEKEDIACKIVNTESYLKFCTDFTNYMLHPTERCKELKLMRISLDFQNANSFVNWAHLFSIVISPHLCVDEDKKFNIIDQDTNKFVDFVDVKSLPAESLDERIEQAIIQFLRSRDFAPINSVAEDSYRFVGRLVVKCTSKCHRKCFNLVKRKRADVPETLEDARMIFKKLKHTPWLNKLVQEDATYRLECDRVNQ
jgi:hypothetical protein